MFNAKRKPKAIKAKKKSTTSVKSTKSPFLTEGLKNSAKTRSGNGAIKFSSTGQSFVDQFGAIGSYKEPRDYKDIANDMSILYAENRIQAIQFALYCRIITRKTVLPDGSKTKVSQKGPGLKHEAIMRFLWLAINHKEDFNRNLPLLVAAGSWKDLITMLQTDLVFHKWAERQLDWKSITNAILAGLENPSTSELVKKYLPQIRSKNKCTTIEAQADNTVAKYICSKLFGGKRSDYKYYKQYRKLKSSGTAHEWQKLISNGNHKLIDFDTIAGRALSLLVSSKYISNQGLQKQYEKWIENKPVAKFTGYVHELAAKIEGASKKYQLDTINAQYNKLVEVAGKTNSNFIVVKDTSVSMNSTAYGTNMSSYKVAKSMSIFLGNMLQGAFQGHYIDFSSKAILRKINGSNFVEHWKTENRTASANTNFLAVANLFCNLKSQVKDENDFPSGIVCISDGEFDRTKMYDTTNIQAFKAKLLSAGFSSNFVDNFKFCFWDIRNNFYSYYGISNKTKFESHGPEKNVFYFGGYDSSVITFLTGVEGQIDKLPTTAEELFESAMNQELLSLVK